MLKRKAAAFFILICLFSSSLVFGQTDRGVAVKSTGEKRLALVIGNGAYKNTSPLANPVNDANDIAAALKGLGFEVLFGTNQSKREMEILVRQFGEALTKQGGVGLFFYAGHGLQVNGNNYIVPIEADIPEQDEVEYQAVNLNFLLGKMGLAGNNLNIVILDACRNNPFARNWRNFRDASDSKGLAKVTPPTGTIMLYATQPGNVASDGTGRNGLFTESLLQQIRKPNVELDAMVKLLARDVSSKSNGKQIPWKEGIVLGDFYFAGENNSQPSDSNAAQVITPRPTPLPTPTPISTSGTFDADAVYWNEIQSRNTKSGFELYLAEYPNGKFAKTARDRITEIINQESIVRKNIEKSKWQDAVQNNTKESFNSYLSTYPNGEFATSASQKIKEIEDEEARKKAEIERAQDQAKWDEVSTLNRKSAYQSYLAIYPNGKYSATAKTKIKEFENEEARILLEQQKAKERAKWEEAERLKTVAGYRGYLSIYANGEFASLARLRLSDLGEVVTVSITAGTVITNSLGMRFAYSPAGTFQMGSSNGESDERPVRTVSIGRGFYMGTTEVTQGQWEQLMGTTVRQQRDKASPSWALYGEGVDYPMYYVSWEEAKEYIRRLNARNDGYIYSLPTEAEWEYAAQAGTTGDYAGDMDAMGWYNRNSGGKSSLVGQKQPNAFGLYDMHGNVWEWCEDIYNDKGYAGSPIDGTANLTIGDSRRRVLRGGSWDYFAGLARSTDRSWGAPSGRLNDLGFRVVARVR